MILSSAQPAITLTFYPVPPGSYCPRPGAPPLVLNLQPLLVGPPGPIGPQGLTSAPSRFDVTSAAATWTIPHGLGRAPMAECFSPSGERLFPDVFVDSLHITAVFAAPTMGFVLAQ